MLTEIKSPKIFQEIELMPTFYSCNNEYKRVNLPNQKHRISDLNFMKKIHNLLSEGWRSNGQLTIKSFSVFINTKSYEKNI